MLTKLGRKRRRIFLELCILTSICLSIQIGLGNRDTVPNSTAHTVPCTSTLSAHAVLFLAVRDVVGEGKGRDGGTGERVV